MMMEMIQQEVKIFLDAHTPYFREEIVMNQKDNPYPTLNTPDNDDNSGDDNDMNTLLAPKEKTKRPALYQVLLLNDDFTPMEFVVLILQSLFNKTPEESADITLTVHSKGVGVCGIFPYEIAETKAQQVMDLARKNQHPLQCRIEKE